jgi:protein TBF1
LNAYLNDNIESIRRQGTGTVEMDFSDTLDLAMGTEPGLEGTFDLDAVIAEASKAAQGVVDASAESAGGIEDLSAFLAENISKAAEQAREASRDTELPSAIASAAESASRATMLALQSIQQNKYHPTAPPQSSCKYLSHVLLAQRHTNLFSSITC